MRRNIVECARWAARKDPRIHSFFLGVMRRRGKNKAYVAVARKQITYLWWMLKRQVTYEELIPGSLAGADPSI